MKNEMPIHPGAVLREDILKEMKLSITKAAQNLQVGRKQLSEVVNEGAAISAVAVRLEDAFGVSAEIWLDMQKNYDIWKVKHSGPHPRYNTTFSRTNWTRILIDSGGKTNGYAEIAQKLPSSKLLPVDHNFRISRHSKFQVPVNPFAFKHLIP